MSGGSTSRKGRWKSPLGQFLVMDKTLFWSDFRKYIRMAVEMIWRNATEIPAEGFADDWRILRDRPKS
jgi:hypothetical protein